MEGEDVNAPEKRKASSFDRWFVEQHGPRPSDVPLHEIQVQVRLARMSLAKDEARLRLLEEWEARRTSALYAWQIKDEDKR